MKHGLSFILEAEKRNSALFHFNISNLEFFNAILEVVSQNKKPVFIGVSEGESKFIGPRTLPLLVKDAQEIKNLPVFANADHVKSLERAVDSAKAGFDSITLDASALSLKDAISFVKEAKEEIRKIDSEIIVEGEIGYIGNSSEVIEKTPYDAQDKNVLTTPEDAKIFVEETGVDLFSPAVGNFHGLTDGGNMPHPDFERIKVIKKAVGVPLVLHGGSGISDGDLKKAVSSGISLIHISSELRLAYKQSLSLSLQQKTIAPYKFLDKTMKDLEDVIFKKMALIN